MELATIQDLARLVMQGALHTLRFASDGSTAVVKYYVGSGDNKILTEKRISPSKGLNGVDTYDVKFLNLQS